MDEIDKLVLINFFLNPRASIRELAKRVSMPPSTVEYRLKRLKGSAVRSVKLYVDPSMFGYSQALVIHRGGEPESSVLNFRCVEGLTISQVFYKDRFEMPDGTLKVF